MPSAINNGQFIEMLRGILRYEDDEGYIEARDNGEGSLVIEMRGKDYHAVEPGAEPITQTVTMVVDKKNVTEFLVRMARVVRG